MQPVDIVKLFMIRNTSSLSDLAASLVGCVTRDGSMHIQPRGPVCVVPPPAVVRSADVLSLIVPSPDDRLKIVRAPDDRGRVLMHTRLLGYRLRFDDEA